MSFVEQPHMAQANMLTIPALPDSFDAGQQEPEQQPSMLVTEGTSENLNPTTSTTAEEPPSILPTPPTTPASAPTQPRLPKTSPSPHKSRLRQPQRNWNAGPKATASRDQHSRLPASKTSSVFDRLYKTQTAASKAWTPARAQARKGANHSKVGVDDTLKVFSRLHITGTVSNTSKRVHQRHLARLSPDKSKPPVSTVRTMRSPAKTPTQRFGKSPRKNYVYSPRMKPLTKLYFDSKYHPGLGLETVEPIKLGYSFFQAFCEYENGGIDSHQLAREIILAFFKKDFPAGRHWVMQDPSVEELPGEPHSYNVKMSAKYDWQDGYRVASAKGIVRCNMEKREVRVKDYIYDVASM